MTARRALTDEEVQIARRMKQIIRTSDTLTEESVGVAVGVSQGQISHWTGARLAVPAKRARALARALGIDDPGEISIDYRELNTPNVETPANADAMLKPDERAMLDLWRSLDADGRKAVQAVGHAFEKPSVKHRKKSR